MKLVKLAKIKNPAELFEIEKYLSILNGIVYQKQSQVNVVTLFNFIESNIPLELMETLLHVIYNLCVTPSKDFQQNI